jgi:hypothetical protein
VADLVLKTLKEACERRTNPLAPFLARAYCRKQLKRKRLPAWTTVGIEVYGLESIMRERTRRNRTRKERAEQQYYQDEACYFGVNALRQEMGLSYERAYELFGELASLTSWQVKNGWNRANKRNPLV